MAQAAGLLGFKMMNSTPEDGTCIILLAPTNCAPPAGRAGDRLDLEAAAFISVKRGIWKFDCRATVGDALVCSAESSVRNANYESD